MGGYGSGKQFRSDIKRTTEEFQQLNIQRISAFLKYPSSYFSWNNDISIRVGHNQIKLLYHSSSEVGANPIEQLISLTRTVCNYGGERLWFICPGNNPPCGKRVAVLYAAGPYFFCRHCCNLTYQSRNESESDRLMRKARKIRARLKANHNLLKAIERKPKHMHWKTFETLQMKARLTTSRALALDLAGISK